MPFPGPQGYSSWDVAPPRSAWYPAPQRQPPPSSASDPSRLIKMEPPIFDGTDANGWITRVEYFFNHIALPVEQRLHYAVMLFAPPATDWIFSYRANNPVVTWNQFVDDVRRRFDPHYFVNYMELIAKLTQTGSISEYNKEFERMMNQITGVSEATLLSVYLGGLQTSLKSHVRFQHPISVASAMAIAVEFESTADRSAAPARRQWQGREFRPPSGSGQQSGTVEPPPGSSASGGAKQRDYSKLPIVRLTAAERAEKSRLGLCWYCSEKWSSGHVCKGRFLAYMGSDGEEDDDLEPPVSAPTMGEVVAADLSHLYSMDGRSRPMALEFQGFLGTEKVFILVDTGSSHNFLHPRVAERTQLELEEITPFRVYVGNRQSLTCSNVASRRFEFKVMP